MKKKLASLTAAFTLAVAGIVGPAAQAQTVSVYGNNGVSYTQPAGNYVSQNDISTVANALGVMTPYPSAGKGFSSGILHRTGQHIGLEFDLHGNGSASVVRAYNLDNPAVMRQFQAAAMDAQRMNDAMNGNYNVRRHVQPQYRPTVPDVLVGVGLLYILHEAIDNNRDRHRYDRYDRNHRYDRHDRFDRHDRHDRHRNDHRGWNHRR